MANFVEENVTFYGNSVQTLFDYTAQRQVLDLSILKAQSRAPESWLCLYKLDRFKKTNSNTFEQPNGQN